ncbi:MAG: S-layer homology domain-containing protein [Butyricicoccus sp.]|nr:S-layer homology domain-containing protein [Butyricicoccus sp.]
MKKILKIAAPFLLILAAFASYYVSADSRMAFSDIAGHWAAEEIEKWSARGVINGSEGKFRPDESLSLAELAVIYTRIMPLGEAAENNFEDLPGDAWYTEAILRCVGAGIVDAGGKSEIGPGEAMTRAETFMTLVRAFDIKPAGGEALLGAYNDAKRLTPEQRPYFEALLELGLISGGSEVQLYPGDGISRAEVVDMLERLERAGLIEGE